VTLVFDIVIDSKSKALFFRYSRQPPGNSAHSSGISSQSSLIEAVVHDPEDGNEKLGEMNVSILSNRGGSS
jgi:hypothetical protein